MENTEKDKTMFEIILFFYQLESMLKNHNSMMSEKISEGDLISASIAFNNALILSNMKRIVKENPSIEEYSKSKEFKERLESLLSAFKTSTTPQGHLN